MRQVLSILSFGEFTRLIASIFLDSVEYIIPLLLTPAVGDILDVLGFIYCVYAFGWIGGLAALELVPSMDVIPINILTWMVWFWKVRRDRSAATA